MDGKFILDINDFGKINKANIEIAKINVVGGVNSSGKSTASKLLYCFLKANSNDANNLIFPEIISDINDLIKWNMPPGRYNFSKYRYHIDESDDFDQMLSVYNRFKEKYSFNKMYIKDTFVVEEKIRYIDNFLDSYFNGTNYFSSLILQKLLNDESLILVEDSPNYLKGEEYEKNEGKLIKFYSDNFESIISSNLGVSMEDDGNGNMVFNEKGDFECSDDFFHYSTKGSIKNLNNIFYLGSLSIFDLDSYIDSFVTFDSNKPILGYEEHITHLIENLHEKGECPIDEELIYSVKTKIDKIIEGNFENDESSLLNFSFKEKNAEDLDINMVNTSSGIKQIGIVELLLANFKLIPGTFLIIDEPEVNLHPEWQFKFAEILVLLAKELDITIYLNSHSPMFIEAIEVLTQYYDLEEDTNFYLTEKSVGGKYDFIKIDYENLYDLYDDLSKPFDAIEVYRLKSEYKKGNY